MRDKLSKLDTYIRLPNTCWIPRAGAGRGGEGGEGSAIQKITWTSKRFPGILVNAQKASSVFQVQSDT